MRELMPSKGDYGMLVWPSLLGIGFFAVLVLLLVSGRRLGKLCWLRRSSTRFRVTAPS